MLDFQFHYGREVPGCFMDAVAVHLINTFILRLCVPGGGAITECMRCLVWRVWLASSAMSLLVDILRRHFGCLKLPAPV